MGSGLTVQPWWERAVFCTSGSDLQRVLGEVETLQKVGCDAVEVTPGSGYTAVVEMDALIDAAARRRMHVVVDLNGRLLEQNLRERIAFWGARGVAAFAVEEAAASVVGQLRQANPGRLIIGENGQLSVLRLPNGDAPSLRIWLSAQSALRQGFLLEDLDSTLGNTRAAILIASGRSVRIKLDAVVPQVANEQIPAVSPEDLLLWVPKANSPNAGAMEWVQALNKLHHEDALLRTGRPQPLNLDALGVLAWVMTNRDGHEALLVICNLSGKLVQVPFAAAIQALGVKGTSLKTLLRRDASIDATTKPDGVELEADGVFVGTLGAR